MDSDRTCCTRSNQSINHNAFILRSCSAICCAPFGACVCVLPPPPDVYLLCRRRRCEGEINPAFFSPPLLESSVSAALIPGEGEFSWERNLPRCFWQPPTFLSPRLCGFPCLFYAGERKLWVLCCSPSIQPRRLSPYLTFADSFRWQKSWGARSL